VEVLQKQKLTEDGQVDAFDGADARREVMPPEDYQ
jgi:hypothetical protein